MMIHYSKVCLKLTAGRCVEGRKNYYKLSPFPDQPKCTPIKIGYILAREQRGIPG